MFLIGFCKFSDSFCSFFENLPAVKRLPAEKLYLDTENLVLQLLSEIA
jgi:hypothetical protein